jgi:hypothetical protein
VVHICAAKRLRLQRLLSAPWTTATPCIKKGKNKKPKFSEKESYQVLVQVFEIEKRIHLGVVQYVGKYHG